MMESIALVCHLKEEVIRMLFPGSISSLAVRRLAVALLCAAFSAGCSPISPQKYTDSGYPIVGAWEVCGSSPGYLDVMDPRGTPNMKALFNVEGKLYFQRPDRTMNDRQSLEVTSYTYRDGKLAWKNGDVLSEFSIEFLGADSFRAIGKVRSFLYCRLGAGQESFDRALQPQSIDYFIAEGGQNKHPISNPRPRTPPAGTLLGTWELVRITTEPDPNSLPPYGFPAVRVVIEADRICRIVSSPSGIPPTCTPAEIDGMRIVIAENDADGLLGMFNTGTPLSLNSYGGLSLDADGSIYDFMWIGPEDGLSFPLPARLVLLNIVR